jgi:hypothetical protein
MGKENEAGMYIGKMARPVDRLRAVLTCSVYDLGTSLRELVHKFRHRTLTLVKMMMLQKRVCLGGIYCDEPVG